MRLTQIPEFHLCSLSLPVRRSYGDPFGTLGSSCDRWLRYPDLYTERPTSVPVIRSLEGQRYIPVEHEEHLLRSAHDVRGTEPRKHPHSD